MLNVAEESFANFRYAQNSNFCDMCHGHRCVLPLDAGETPLVEKNVQFLLSHVEM